ncbi:MAG: MBL fold metallo-hydrolase [Nitrospinota bacterium]
MRWFCIWFAVGFCLSSSPPAEAQGEVRLRWYGHSFFLLTSAAGVRVAIDPFGRIGYPLPRVGADVVALSHEHSDHNNAALIGGNPRILRGLAPGGDWAKVDFTRKDVRIRSFPAFHDEAGGSKRGKNGILLLEVSGLRIAHLSDIGAIPDEEVLRTLEGLDVLLVPVGGYFSIDGPQAADLVRRLRPRVAIPHHYKTPATADWPIADEGPFLARFPRARRLGVSELRLEAGRLPAPTEVWVMDYR